MMTRGEAGKKLNSILEAADDLQTNMIIGIPRVRERLNAIRDQVMLLALDLGLPLQAQKEKVGDDERNGGDTSSSAPTG